jgi:hypothetical protein
MTVPEPCDQEFVARVRAAIAEADECAAALMVEWADERRPSANVA